MNTKSKRALPVSPQPKTQSRIPTDIEFALPIRTRSDAKSCRVTQTINKMGKSAIRLIVTRDVLHDAGFKAGQKLIVLQGKPPHARWIRVEASDYGQKLGEKGPVGLSLKSILRTNLPIKNEEVQPLPSKNTVYFELPETWIAHSMR